jgi:hypothetical protein
MQPYEVKIARFGLYPAEEPTCYCVGFSGSTATSDPHYQDTQVPLEEAKGKSEEEIVTLAWEKLKDGFTARMETLAAKSPLQGQVWDHQAGKLAAAAQSEEEGK